MGGGNFGNWAQVLKIENCKKSFYVIKLVFQTKPLSICVTNLVIVTASSTLKVAGRLARDYGLKSSTKGVFSCFSLGLYQGVVEVFIYSGFFFPILLYFY